MAAADQHAVRSAQCGLYVLRTYVLLPGTCRSAACGSLPLWEMKQCWPHFTTNFEPLARLSSWLTPPPLQGFFSVVALPMYTALATYFPGCAPLLAAVKDNLAMWVEREEAAKSKAATEPGAGAGAGS